MERNNIFLLSFIVFVLLASTCLMTWTLLAKNEFEDDYASLSDAYERVLLATAQHSPDSTQLMQEYITIWDRFTSEYWRTPPKRFVTEHTWWPALNRIEDVIDTSSILIRQENYDTANKELLKIQSAWQQVFEKQQASMIGYYLVEFNAELGHAVTEARSGQYGLMQERCTRLRSIWDAVMDAPVSVAAQRMQDFQEKVKTESVNIDNFCAAVSSQDSAKMKEFASLLQEDFAAIYLKYG